MARKKSIEEVRKFVLEESKCKLLSTEYKNVDSLLEFECECGEKFQTTFYKFDKRKKRQCNSCGFRKGQHSILKFEDVKEFIEHKSNSGCQLLSESYENAHAKLKLKCKCGEVFNVKWAHFRNSNQRQCKTCGIQKRSKKREITFEDVVRYIEFKDLKLKNEYLNQHSPLQIECKCGKVFSASYVALRYYGKDKCNKCRKINQTTSEGEDKIREWLTFNQIDFKEQYTFENLKIEKKLRFDFAILNKKGKLKMLVEFDGKQHFGLGNFSDDTEKMKENFERIQESDMIKNEFCFDNSIPLLRIPYFKLGKIEEILSDALL